MEQLKNHFFRRNKIEDGTNIRASIGGIVGEVGEGRVQESYNLNIFSQTQLVVE